MTLVSKCISLQVSFVQYSDEVKSEFKLNTYNDKAMALGALQNIRYRGGNTRTGTVQHHRCRPSLPRADRMMEASAHLVLIVVPLSPGHGQCKFSPR